MKHYNPNLDLVNWWLGFDLNMTNHHIPLQKFPIVFSADFDQQTGWTLAEMFKYLPATDLEVDMFNFFYVLFIFVCVCVSCSQIKF